MAAAVRLRDRREKDRTGERMEHIQKKGGRGFVFFGLSYYGVFAMISILSGRLNGISWIKIAKIGIPAILLFSFLLYTSDDERIFGGWKRRLSGRAALVLFGCGVLSGTVLLLAPWKGMEPLWFLATVAAAVFLGSVAGFGVHLCFCLLWFSQHETEAAKFGTLLVLGAFYCFLVRYFKELQNLIAIIVMLVILQLSLLFLANDFLLVGWNRCLSEIGAGILMVFAGFLLTALKAVLLVQKKKMSAVIFGENISSAEKKKAEESRMAAGAEPAQETVRELVSERHENTKSKLLEIAKPEYELMARMERASKALYDHSRLVGDTAAEAAELIGADELLTRVGGYYHEIGRLRTDGVKRNYIENGLIHLREHDFPEEVMEIVCQHNIKRETPKSREAALVMISDSVFSMREYIRQQGNYDKEKQHEVVEHMLRLRFREGTLDDSGLSVREFNLLRKYYLKLVETMPLTGKTGEES